MRSESAFSTGIDNLRFLATAGVVLLHVSAAVLPHFQTLPSGYWLSGLALNAATRWCVPAFVMISGALLLPKEMPVARFLQKRFSRILFPFLFYASLYLIWFLSLRLLYGHQNSPDQTWQWLSQKVKSGVSYHFWFVYMILGLYLFIPVLGKWVRQSSDKEIPGFILLWFVANQINDFGIFGPYYKNELGYFSGYIGYLVWGYYLAHRLTISAIRAKQAAAVLIFTGYFVLFFSTLLASLDAGKTTGVLYGNFSPCVWAIASGLFLVCSTISPVCGWRNAVVHFVCRYSFGIYLIHILILKWLTSWGIHWNMFHPALAIPVTTLLCLLLSSCFAWIISKLPFGNKISG